MGGRIPVTQGTPKRKSEALSAAEQLDVASVRGSCIVLRNPVLMATSLARIRFLIVLRCVAGFPSASSGVDENVTPGAPWRIRLTGDLRSRVAEEATPEGYLTMYQATRAGWAFPGQTVWQCQSTTARGSPIQASTLWDDVAFSTLRAFGTSELDPFRSSILGPWSPL
jgi:hypothetical protein